MKEIGIDISGQRSKSVDEFSGQSIDYVVTVCDNARDNCPVFPAGTERIHWSFEDPAAVQGSEQERLAAFRRIRDQIHERVKAFFRDRAAPARSLLSAATTSSGKVSLPALTLGSSPPAGYFGGGWGELPDTSTGIVPK